MRFYVGILIVLGVWLPSQAKGQPASLHLRFDGSEGGEAGEQPLFVDGVDYEIGVIGEGARFLTPNELIYPAEDNISPTEGSLLFWLKPDWAGDDGVTHTFLGFGTGGSGGGMLFTKDGANNLRSIFNQYSVNGIPEMGVAVNVDDWSRGEWRHIAYTWSNANGRLRLYVDGVLLDEFATPVLLPAGSATTFQVGADGPGAYTEGVLDELRIFDVELSAAQVAASIPRHAMARTVIAAGGGEVQGGHHSIRATIGQSVDAEADGSNPPPTHTIQSGFWHVARYGACCWVDGCTPVECLDDGLCDDDCYGVCDTFDWITIPAYVGCFGDLDGNNVVNPGERGFVSANIGQTNPVFVCLYDLDGNGVINPADRGFVSANIGLCTPRPDYQNGSGLNHGVPDARFPADFQGLGTTCETVVCP